jgi:YVTN family beta-propeller protein
MGTKRCMLLVCVIMFTLSLPCRSRAQAVSCTYAASSGQPTEVAFDESGNAWVSFYSGDYVAKIQASTCTVLATVRVGSGPEGIAFDGTYMWVANRGSNTVSKVDTLNNTLVASYAVGSYPWGVVFQGGYIWVSNQNSNTVTKLTTSGEIIGNFAVGTKPHQLLATADGVWVTNNGSNNVMYLGSTGQIIYTVATGSEPNWITFDGNGGNIWVSCWSSEEIDKISSEGSLLAKISVSAHGGPEGLTWDINDGLIWGVTWNGYLFSINYETDALTYYDVSGLAGQNLWGITVDQNNQYLWLTEVNANKVVKLTP